MPISYKNILQEGKVYLSAMDLDDIADAQKAYYQHSVRATKRARGLPEESRLGPMRKKQRLKTYASIMHLDNMVRKSCGHGLPRIQVREDAEGNWPPDPFSWPRYNLASDCGPDMVCAEHFLTYQLSLNMNWDYDMSHLGAAVSRCSLKENGLWRSHVL